MSRPPAGIMTRSEMTPQMPRQPEVEAMDQAPEVEAYAKADFSQVNQAFVDRLLGLASQAARTARALDLGTGPGDIPIRLARARPGWRITAIDVSKAMLAHARRAAEAAGLAANIDFVLADAKATRLPAGGFDVIFSNSILHHISQMDRFWAELKRLAAPGAVVFLRDLFRPADEAAAGRIVAKHAGGESALLREEYYRSLLSAWTIGEVRGQLNRAGLSELAVAAVNDRHMDVIGRLS